MDTKRSLVWKYFMDLRKVDGSSFVECTLCKKKYSHKGNTTNMFHHLKANHTAIYHETLRERQNNPGRTSYDSSVSKYELPPALLQIKAETVYSDADQSYISEHNSQLQDHAMSSRSIAEPICNFSIQDTSIYKPEDQGEMSPEPSTSYLNISNMQPRRMKFENEVCSKLMSIAAGLEEVKEKIPYGGDTHFFNSISSELENMDEASKDLVKAAIWQILYKVKCARNKNEELTLGTIFKD